MSDTELQQEEQSIESKVSSELEKRGLNQSSSDIEALAKSYGWNPEGSKGATEFIEYALKELEPRGRELKEIKQTLNELKGHIDQAKMAGYKQAIADAERKREEAIAYGDVDAVNEAEREIQTIQNTAPPVAAEQDPDIKAFSERHRDILIDPSMEAQEIRNFMQKRDAELSVFKLPPKEVLQIIEDDIRKKFPERFGEEIPRHRKVDSDSTFAPVKSKSKYGFNDLNDYQKQCCRHFVKRGVFKSDQDYIKQLVEIGEL